MRIILLLVTGNFGYSQDFKNPYFLNNEWPGYSIGDPYVLKHRGVFYLYCSTKDSEIGVKCWSSKDLINWTYEGLCASDPLTKGAYAPEVVYWNGTFYMYTSPGGNGHYVLASEKPTGPFEIISKNLGKTIDGSIFIDDDAKWTFLHASSEGILGCAMSSPVSIGMDIYLNAQINQSWTEGPCMFKRNGKYYIIYTGNHVLSKGYRIDYAVNSQGPLSQFTPVSDQNPFLLDALGNHVGLGHGSIFIGPDLDSYYLTYHNLISEIGPFRRLNFDRIAWNGDKMVLLGPTDFPQENPKMPDAYDYFDRTEPGSDWLFPLGGLWEIKNASFLSQDTIIANGENYYLAVLDKVAKGNFIAEFNFRETERENDSSKLGAVFSYSDNYNYGTVTINSLTNTCEINFKVNNSWSTPAIINLPNGLDYTKWHNIRIEKFNNLYRFFIDNLLKYTANSELDAGRIGYMTNFCKGDFGYIAFSNYVMGSGIFDIYKPVPGKLPAVLYNSGGEGKGFHKNEGLSDIGTTLRTDEVKISKTSWGDYCLSSIESGEWFKYNINVERDTLYNVELIYAAENYGARVRFFLDSTYVLGEADLPSTGNNSNLKSYVIKDLRLKAGFHALKVEAISGTFELYSLEFVLADNKAFDKLVSFDGAFGTGWKYSDGNWEIIDKCAFIDGYGKRTYGSEFWRNYTVEADILFTRNMNAGLIFRVNNPAMGGAGNDPALGTDFLQGYYVGFSSNSIILGKHNYGWKMLYAFSKSFSLNTWYHLRVVIYEDRIRIYIDDMENSVIDYTDPEPWINGMAGLRSFNTGVKFDNFHVTSNLLINNVKTITDNSSFSIYPNPASRFVTLNFRNEINREIRVIDIKGSILLSFKTNKEKISFSLSELMPGIYILSVQDEYGITAKKIILN